MREWDLLTGPRGWIRRHPSVLAIIWATLLVTGIILMISALLTETRLVETRAFQGTVPHLAEDRDAQPVPEAIYEGFGLAEGRATELECGVAIHFLSEVEAQEFQRSGALPPPQLHCQRTAVLLPGSVADIRIQNLRLNASAWHFELALFEFSSPRNALLLPAAAFLLVGGLGLTISFFQWAIGRWLEETRK
jgi:hypothetical protein